MGKWLGAFLIRPLLKKTVGNGFATLRRLGRGALRTDRRIIDSYLARGGARKLHLGCGRNLIEGWLNTDYRPKSKGVAHVDCTREFPFSSEQFDYVFTEHLIEHVDYDQGARMLRECFRVLKPGGNIRVTTPDLKFLISLYVQSTSQIEHDYIKWAIERAGDAPFRSSVFVINNFMRDWGHRFIYDEEILTASLKAAGFHSVVRCELNESENAALRDLENDSRMPEGFLALESMTLEATRP